MKNYKLYTVVFTTFIFSLINLSADETTGSFNFNLNFNGEMRTIACFVPNDYVQSNQYKLFIGLHGAGDNAVSYRDVLINNAKWNELFANTIFIFPDGGSDQSKDFLFPIGDEAIIDSVIAWAKSNYTIEPNSITLQGFSLGGRSALKYGLDYPEKVNGLLLHTPAMQSPFDVQNNQDFSAIFNYSNANKIPISISHGDQDMGFYRTIKMLADSLVEYNAELFYLLIENMNHSITPNQITNAMYQFLYTPINEAVPVIHKLNGDLISYNKNANLFCRVRNIGDVAINKLTFEHTVDGVKSTFDWTGNITKEQFVDIIIPNREYSEGVHTASITIKSFNDQPMQGNPLFNSLFNFSEFYFNVFETGTILPFVEKFTDPNLTADNFSIKESGNFISWMPMQEIGKDGDGCMFMLNSLLAYTNFGLIESMYSRKFDFTGISKPALKFDVAYNYCYYLPPYFSSKTVFTDTLQIFISNDEWKTSTPIFKKWGDDLRTFSAPLENPLDFGAFQVAPQSNEWKNFEIELAEFNVNDKTMFKIDYISGSGGVIYFDNFNVFDKDAVSVEDNKNTDFMVYPNPATSNSNVVISINSVRNDNCQIELYDISGNKIINLINNDLAVSENSFAVKLPNLSAGMYILKAKYNNSEKIKKIIIK